MGMADTSVYAAGKAALRSMARSLSRELLPRGIRVNAVSPGPVDTGILETMMSAEAAERFKAERVADNPMRRFGTPDEFAAAAAFLAFDATYTAGAEFAVDGGATQL
jgi:NAD(P)-dependent dehydrogenase (short-subunit alcohol dehydrogenase family)